MICQCGLIWQTVIEDWNYSFCVKSTQKYICMRYVRLKGLWSSGQVYENSWEWGIKCESIKWMSVTDSWRRRHDQHERVSKSVSLRQTCQVFHGGFTKVRIELRLRGGTDEKLCMTSYRLNCTLFSTQNESDITSKLYLSTSENMSLLVGRV